MPLPTPVAPLATPVVIPATVNARLMPPVIGAPTRPTILSTVLTTPTDAPVVFPMRHPLLTSAILMRNDLSSATTSSRTVT